MQPYLFPYLGYVQLIQAADIFVIYDDAQFMKGGWVNRNRILSANGPQAFTLQLIGASANKQINQIAVGANRNKLLRTIEQTYAKAPYITETKTYIERCFAFDDNNLGAFLSNSLIELAKLLDLPTQFKFSSELTYDRNASAQNKVLTMCKSLGATRYINAEGGRELYHSEPFKAAGIDLRFLQHISTPYQQHRRSQEFEARLSVIDALMNVGVTGVRDLLNDFTLETK